MKKKIYFLLVIEQLNNEISGASDINKKNTQSENYLIWIIISVSVFLGEGLILLFKKWKNWI